VSETVCCDVQPRRRSPVAVRILRGRILTEYANIAIHGVPRSGTTWVGEILNSSPQTVYKYQPLFSYAFKSFLTPESPAQEIQKFFRLLAARRERFLDQEEARLEGTLPTFFKRSPTHLVYKEVRYHHILDNMLKKASDIRLVAVIRNPLSVVSSWVSALDEFRKDQGWIVAQEWKYATRKNRGRPEEFFGFEKWKEATQLFLNLELQFPDKVYVLNYETLVHSPEREVDNLFRFCKLKVSSQTRKFLAESTAVEKPGTYSVYRAGKTTRKWKTFLSPEIAESIVKETRAANLQRYLAEKGA